MLNVKVGCGAALTFTVSIYFVHYVFSIVSMNLLRWFKIYMLKTAADKLHPPGLPALLQY